MVGPPCSSLELIEYFIEKATQLTSLSREVEFCVVGQGLGKVELHILLSVELLIGFCFFQQFEVSNIGLIFLCSLLDGIVNQRNVFLPFLIQYFLFNFYLQDFFLSLSIRYGLEDNL